MDFTGAYRSQSFACGEGFEWLDCRAIEGTDCYCDKEGEAALRKLIAAFSPYGLHFLDSGNYHYVTKFWTDKIRERFSLVLFDHHTDMQPAMFEGLLSCGGWVKDMLDANPFLQKVLIIGVPEEEAPELPIYVSVDKDVLSKECASTNWDQGNLASDFLMDAIACLMSRYRVIGMDVCGEPDASGGFHACNSNLNNTVNVRLAELWKSNSPHLPR